MSDEDWKTRARMTAAAKAAAASEEMPPTGRGPAGLRTSDATRVPCPNANSFGQHDPSMGGTGTCEGCDAEHARLVEKHIGPRPASAPPSERDRAIWEARKRGDTVEQLGERHGLRREKVTQICALAQAAERAACDAVRCRGEVHEPPCPLSDPAELAQCADIAVHRNTGCMRETCSFTLRPSKATEVDDGALFIAKQLAACIFDEDAFRLSLQRIAQGCKTPMTEAINALAASDKRAAERAERDEQRLEGAPQRSKGAADRARHRDPSNWLPTGDGARHFVDCGLFAGAACSCVPRALDPGREPLNQAVLDEAAPNACVSPKEKP